MFIVFHHFPSRPLKSPRPASEHPNKDLVTTTFFILDHLFYLFFSQTLPWKSAPAPYCTCVVGFTGSDVKNNISQGEERNTRWGTGHPITRASNRDNFRLSFAFEARPQERKCFSDQVVITCQRNERKLKRIDSRRLIWLICLCGKSLLLICFFPRRNSLLRRRLSCSRPYIAVEWVMVSIQSAIRFISSTPKTKQNLYCARIVKLEDFIVLGLWSLKTAGFLHI